MYSVLTLLKSDLCRFLLYFLNSLLTCNSELEVKPRCKIKAQAKLHTLFASLLSLPFPLITRRKEKKSNVWHLPTKRSTLESCSSNYCIYQFPVFLLKCWFWLHWSGVTGKSPLLLVLLVQGPHFEYQETKWLKFTQAANEEQLQGRCPPGPPGDGGL